MVNKEILITHATTILENNFGKHFSESYREFYTNQTPDTILISLGEILEELFGDKKSKELITELMSKISQGEQGGSLKETIVYDTKL